MGWTISVEEGTEEEAEFVSLECWKVRSRQGTGCRPGRIKLTFDEYSMAIEPVIGRKLQTRVQK